MSFRSALSYGQLLPKLQKMTYQGKLKNRLDEISSVTDWVLHDARRFFS